MPINWDLIRQQPSIPSNTIAGPVAPVTQPMRMEQPQQNSSLGQITPQLLQLLAASQQAQQPNGGPPLGIPTEQSGVNIQALQNQQSNLGSILQNQPNFANTVQNQYLPKEEIDRLQQLIALQEAQKNQQQRSMIQEQSAKAYKSGGFSAIVEQLNQMGLPDQALALQKNQTELRANLLNNKTRLADLDAKELNTLTQKMSMLGNAASVIESLPPEQRATAYAQLRPEVEKMSKMSLPKEYNQLNSLLALTTVMDIKAQIDKNPYIMNRLQPDKQAVSAGGPYVPSFNGNQPDAQAISQNQISQLHNPMVRDQQQGQQRLQEIALAGQYDLAGKQLTNRPQQAAPSGYRWTDNNNLEAIPGGPAQQSVNTNEAGRAQLVNSGLAAANKAQTLMLYPDGSVNTKNLTTMWSNIPGTEGALARSNMEEAVSSILYLKTGAAATPGEISQQLKIYMPRPWDSKATVQDKIQRFNNFMSGIQAQTGRTSAAPAPSSQQQPTMDLNAMAQEAINRGADPKQVYQRLEQMKRGQ